MNHPLLFSRRSLLAGAVAGTAWASGLSNAATEADIFPVVETANGRLRGLMSGGVKVFKGVNYGADTSGTNRFMPPTPVVKWAGVKDATAYGNYAPQLPSNRVREYSDLIMYDIQPGGMGEDCLVLNLWTPNLSKNARRPVLLHLHGGGFYAGSGNSPQFDGEMLARFGDSVVISINHRLGAFGYLNLAEVGGARYATSGASGMLDIVAALGWVRDNVEAFGGDPSRVLVFGQSGGGMKTSVLMAMPSAKGLFHRAGVMSGSALRVVSRDASAQATDTFLKLLGVGKESIGQLEKLPFQQLLAAQVTMEDADRARGEAPRSFSPVLDGVAIPRHPFDPDAPAVSAHVPMMVSTTLDERAYRQINFNLDEAGLHKYAEAQSAGNGGPLTAMYRAEDPTATPFVLQARIDTDMTFRKAAHLQAERRVASVQAPVYTYLWKIPSPAFGGRFGAPHGSDIGPSMHDIRNGLNGPTTANVMLADQLASAWINFAATGNPSNARMPAWPAYTLPARTTMVFSGDSSQTAAQDDPRRAFREYWAAR